MMIASRMVLLTVLLSNCAVVSMEKEHRKIEIQDVLNVIIKPQCEGDLSDVEVVTQYLNNGGNINAKGVMWINPPYWNSVKEVNLLMASAFYGRPKLMKFLINKYARLDCTNEYGDTALMMAVMNGRASLVRLLLNAGANKNIRNNYNRSALDIAYHSPLRHHPFYNQKKRGQNYHFPTMIKRLECQDKEMGCYNQRSYYNQNSYTRSNNFQLRNNQMNNTRNRPQLRIQQ